MVEEVALGRGVAAPVAQVSSVGADVGRRGDAAVAAAEQARRPAGGLERREDGRRRARRVRRRAAAADRRFDGVDGGVERRAVRGAAGGRAGVREAVELEGRRGARGGPGVARRLEERRGGRRLPLARERRVLAHGDGEEGLVAPAGPRGRGDRAARRERLGPPPERAELVERRREPPLLQGLHGVDAVHAHVPRAALAAAALAPVGRRPVEARGGPRRGADEVEQVRARRRRRQRGAVDGREVVDVGPRRQHARVAAPRGALDGLEELEGGAPLLEERRGQLS